MAEVGPLELKGKAEPVAAWEPVGVDESQNRFELLAKRGLTSFVGRNRELESLVAAWQRAAGGRGQVVSIVGEAGLGKSRLLHEFKTEMARRAVPLLEGSCFTYGEATSYLPFLEVARGLLGTDTADQTPACALPASPPRPRRGRRAPRPDSRRPTVRQHTIEAIRDLILARASAEPMVLVVEDVHWIDKASEDVLSAVVEAMADVGLLLVLLYRPEYLHAWSEVAYHAEVSLDRLGGASSAAMVRAILSKSYAASVALDRLSAEDTRSMVRQLLGTATIPPELEQLVATSTDGNPLFIEELTRDLIESGHLVHGDSGYTLTRPPEALTLPTTVQGVLLARVDRLNPNLRGLLQVASVLGRVFTYRLLGAVANLDEGLDSALLQLEDLDLVYQSALAPERQYSFKHVLAQEAVYQTLTKAQREAHHERAGQAVETLYGDRLDEWVELLARHYTRSGNDAKALEYLEWANRKAARANALAEAKGFFDEAMSLLDRIPDTPDNRHRRVVLVTEQFRTYFFLFLLREYLELARSYEAMAIEVDDRPLLGMLYKNIAHCQFLSSASGTRPSASPTGRRHSSKRPGIRPAWAWPASSSSGLISCEENSRTLRPGRTRRWRPSPRVSMSRTACGRTRASPGPTPMPDAGARRSSVPSSARTRRGVRRRGSGLLLALHAVDRPHLPGRHRRGLPQRPGVARPSVGPRPRRRGHGASWPGPSAGPGTPSGASRY